MRKLIIGLMLLLVGVSFLTSCSSVGDPSQMYPGETPEHIYTRGTTELRDKSYSEASKRFEALDVQYPLYKNTERAQLYLIYAYYMKDDYALAHASANHYIRLHPVSPHVDYAYFMKGLSSFNQNMGVFERWFTIDLSNRDLTQMKKAYADFHELVTRYPTSRYTPAGRQYLVYLRNMFADHELHVAEFYFRQQAYVAASDRATNVVLHYQGAPAVKPALQLLVESYRALQQTEKMQQAEAVYRTNYHSEPSEAPQ